MWFKLLGFFFGGASPIKALTDTYIRYKDSQDHSLRLLAEEAKSQRDALLAEQQAALTVRLASMGFWEMRMLTAATLFFFVSHLGLVWYDTIMTSVSLGIPKLPAPIDEWEGTIILSLFGISAGERSVRAISAAIATRRK